MLGAGYVDIVTIVWVLSPPEVHVLRVRIVEFVIVTGRPLNVNSSTFGIAKTIAECNFQHGWVEIVVEYGCRKWLKLVDTIADREECWPIDRSTERVALLRYDDLRGGDESALRERLDEVPRGGDVVVVCKMGIVAKRATRLLREEGYDAATLRGGMSGWRGYQNGSLSYKIRSLLWKLR